MSHPSKIVSVAGPEAPHAFDHIPVQPRHGALDAICVTCRGHGQWNVEIDLISHRSKRACCATCHGSGWIETGDDPVLVNDITRGSDGVPRWGTRGIGG